MKTIKIQIPNMQSAHCQTRVRNAITSIQGANINNIEAGVVSITVDNVGQESDAKKAIEKAGYTVQHVDDISQLKGDGQTFQFKTNINCSDCVAKVTPALNATEGICHWDVDITGKDKILSVHSINISKQDVMDSVKNAGFQIESINS